LLAIRNAEAQTFSFASIFNIISLNVGDQKVVGCELAPIPIPTVQAFAIIHSELEVSASPEFELPASVVDDAVALGNCMV